MKYLLSGLMLLSLCACQQPTPAQITNIANDGKLAIQLSDAVLNDVNAVVQVAAPGSTTAHTLGNVVVTANKVDNIVQSLTIPVIPIPVVAAPAAATTGQ